tara:strand:- start:467 stop:856 length:390 start_codon:yes stop_codon:yes gene_type:complete
MSNFEQFLRVKSEDLDHLDHVNNVRYLEWIQKLARNHWEAVTTTSQREKNIWVVLKHEINYKSSAFLGDYLKLSTSVKKNHGIINVRKVEISNVNTNKLIVKSKTKWCLIDPSTKKPKRIPDDILTIFD